MSTQKEVKHSFIATGDIHLGWKLYNIPELQYDAITLFERVVDLAIEKSVTYFIVPGDLYDTQTPSEQLVKFVSEQVTRLRAHGIIPIGISGDHDKRPGVDTTWINDVNGFDTSLGRVIGLNYKNFLDVPGTLKGIPPAVGKEIHWLVLHGQEETMFPFVDEKKRLRLKEIDYTEYPNLKGIILGDIHGPVEGNIELPELKRRIPVYYTGSLNVVRSNEIGEKKGVLYFDGEKMDRLQVEPARTYAKFNLPDDAYLLPDFLKAIENEKEKPLMVVSYVDDLPKEQLDSLKAFDGKVFLKTSRVRKKGEIEESVNIRSELRTDNKIEAVANILIEDETLRKLFIDLISSSDPKGLLDEFKNKMLK